VLAFVYCEGEPSRRAAANLLTKDEARRIAANIAKCRHFSSDSLAILAAIRRASLRVSSLPVVRLPGSSSQ
jgi:hypothetical protein